MLISRNSRGVYRLCSLVVFMMLSWAPTLSRRLNTSDSKSLWACFIMRLPATVPTFLTLVLATFFKCSASLAQ